MPKTTSKLVSSHRDTEYKSQIYKHRYADETVQDGKRCHSRLDHCDLGVRNHAWLPKDFKCANGPCSDGEASASGDGAADRPRADDDPLPPGRTRSAPTPRWPRATLRGTRSSDRHAL